MTRNEAIEHARYVRNLRMDASVIALDADVIDALLASPWHDFSAGDRPQKCDWYFVRFRSDGKLMYEKALFDLTYGWLCPNAYEGTEVIHWMEIPPVD